MQHVDRMEAAGAPWVGAQGQLDLLWPEATQRWFRPDAVMAGPGQVLRGYQLFFALFPSHEDALRIRQVVAGLHDLHGLGGTPMLPERLHISLLAIAAFPEAIPQPVVDAAIAAANRVVWPPLPIVFERMRGYANNAAHVLLCRADTDAALAPLRKVLARELRKVGLRPQSSSTPHMTTLYHPRSIAEHSITPICWTATRCALVLSHRGLRHHQWVREWALVGG